MSKEIIIKIPYFETSAPATETAILPIPSQPTQSGATGNPVPSSTLGYQQRPIASTRLPEPLPAERLAVLAGNQALEPQALLDSPPAPHSNPGPEDGAYVAGKADPDKK